MSSELAIQQKLNYCCCRLKHKVHKLFNYYKWKINVHELLEVDIDIKLMATYLGLVQHSFSNYVVLQHPDFSI